MRQGFGRLTGPQIERRPDENGVELNWDRPSDEWPHTAGGALAMFTHPLDMQGLLNEFRPEPQCRAARGP
jgi:catechol-2,3-dioxygenase